MKNSTKKKLAWILILVPAFYIAYHSIMNGAFSGNYGTYGSSFMHLMVLIAVVIWLIGDYLLSETKK